MKLQFYKNIDVVQINIKEGVSEYYFPQNVDWADKKIDKMLVYATNEQTDSYSPFDSQTLITDWSGFKNVYLDLYKEDNTQIAYSLAAQNIFYTNNNPLEINSKISLQLSKLYFTEVPDSDACVLIYVFWDTKYIETDDIPNRSVTINVPLVVGKDIILSEVIDTYIYGQSKKIKGIIFWQPPISWFNAFLTLRDRNNKTVVKCLPLEFCRPPMGLPEVYHGEPISFQTQRLQKDSLYLDCADIDFDNSTIFSPSLDGVGEKVIPTIITFLY